MSESLYDPELTPLLQMSGEHIGQYPTAEERLAWTMFLLDEVKQFLSAAEYADYLQGIKREIDARQAAAGG